MTEDFKKGLATGIAVGGVTVKKTFNGNVLTGTYTYKVNTLVIVPTILTGVFTDERRKINEK